MSSKIAASSSSHQSKCRLKLYWKETKHLLTANVHGVGDEEVTVDIRDRRVFLIIGEGHECYRGSFAMPENVNLNKTKTVIYNGVLSVSVPKLMIQQQPKRKNTAAVASQAHGCRRCFFFFFC